MSLTRYGFIVKAPGYQSDTHHAVIETPQFRTQVVCVSSVAEAQHVARQMIANGIELIELCGGFGQEGMAELVAALNTEIPVGYVTFAEQENTKLLKYLKRVENNQTLSKA